MLANLGYGALFITLLISLYGIFAAIYGTRKNLPAWVELGNLYFDSDRPQEAIEAYRQYLATKPDNPDVRTDMGVMYRKLGQSDKALEEFGKAAQSDPKHANSRYNIGIVLLHDKQNIRAAIKAWEEVLKINPGHRKAFMNIHKAKRRGGL